MSQARQCRVCGVIANSFNYGGRPSCESCKVFFCRNSSRLESLKCRNHDRCQIGLTTRRDCPRCRLAKCYAIGMKKPPNTELSVVVERPVMRARFNPIEHLLESYIIPQLSKKDFEFKLQNQSSIPESNATNTGIVDIDSKLYQFQCMIEAGLGASVLRSESTVPVTARVNTLQEARDSHLFDSMSYMKNVIDFCQYFAIFNHLPNEEQLLMVRRFFFYFVEVWFDFHYDNANKGVRMFKDESESEVVLISSKVGVDYKNQSALKEMKQFALGLITAMEQDINIRNILLGLLLFRTKEKLSSQENIRYHYHSFCLLLQQYLLMRNKDKRIAARKYRFLMRLLDRFDQQQLSNHKTLAIEFGLERLPKIARELYNFV